MVSLDRVQKFVASLEFQRFSLAREIKELEEYRDMWRDEFNEKALEYLEEEIAKLKKRITGQGN